MRCRAQHLRRVLWVGIAGALAGYALIRLAPFPEQTLAAYPSSRWLTDRDGSRLRVVLGPGDTRCDPVSLEASGRWAASAIVAAEDGRFYRHPGVDPLAVLRAMGQNLTAGRVVSGASTLSTQVVKLTQPRPRNLATKAVEAFQALQLERHTSKDAILEQYLNRAPFGSNLVGVEAAARRYFGRDAADLTLGEAALLMGLPQAPSRLRPDRHPDAAVARRRYVLRRMEECGLIDPSRRMAAEVEPVEVTSRPPAFLAPHFCDLVMRLRPDAFLDPGVDGGNEVCTTLDLDLQRMTEDLLRRQAADLATAGVYGGAVVIIEVAGGRVAAMVGSPDYSNASRAGQVNAAHRPRSPGSALKPFAYGMAFDRGFLTPESVLRDLPRTYRDYVPRNFDLAFHDVVTVREALVASLNIPALTTTERLGLPAFHQRLADLGLETLDRPPSHYGLSLVLGTAEVRLLDLANAYACLARLGVYRPYRLLRSDPDAPGRRLFSAASAYLLAEVLSDAERAAIVAGHAADRELPRMALKTGTSSGARDAWALAYNPDYVVGVWLGNPEGTPAPGLTGLGRAAPLAHQIMRRLYPAGRAPWFEPPPRVVRRSVCARSGHRETTACRSRFEALFIAGVSSSSPCPVCRDSDFAARHGATVVGRPVSEKGTPAGVRIESPVSGVTYRKTARVSSDDGAIPLRATVAGPGAEVFWFIDGELIASGGPGESVWWPPETGEHTVVCSTDAGDHARVRFTVEGTRTSP